MYQMESLGYYRDVGNSGCDVQSDEEPLVVNCVGRYREEKAFRQQNINGRKDFYLQVVTEGRLMVSSFGEPEAMTAGMFTLYRPHMSYSYELLPGDTLGYYWMHFTGFHAGRMLANLGINSDRIYRTDGNEKRMQRIVRNFTRLFEEFADRRPGFNEACSSLAGEILIELVRGADCAGAGPLRKLESVSYLHSHFREDTRIAELAAMEHLSESRYREVFRTQTGLSPGDYRTALRMQHACELLTLTDSTITEIAAECGYADVLYFLRVFKSRKGMTPGEFRERSRMS